MSLLIPALNLTGKPYLGHFGANFPGLRYSQDLKSYSVMLNQGEAFRERTIMNRSAPAYKAIFFYPIGNDDKGVFHKKIIPQAGLK